MLISSSTYKTFVVIQVLPLQTHLASSPISKNGRIGGSYDPQVVRRSLRAASGPGVQHSQSEPEYTPVEC
jgi:hypothetical protein